MARHPTYLGPKIQIQPKDLERYEASGMWAAEEKHDGHWTEVLTDATGRISRLTARSGKTFSGSNIDGLIGLQLHLQNATLIAELEAGTEAAGRHNAKLGHKRLHLFDIVRLLNTSVAHLSYADRRTLLEKAYDLAGLSSEKSVTLVRQQTKGFNLFFKRVVAEGGEGLVLKRLDKGYHPHGGGKTDDWVRCKQFRFVDYVVMSIGKSDGGSPNFQVGLYVKGKLQRVATIKNIPKGLDYEPLVGRVIECKGAEIHDSGALRHGHYERTRDDKDPEECTLETALES
jgi:ATP-dependent DNA ligase